MMGLHRENLLNSLVTSKTGLLYRIFGLVSFIFVATQLLGCQPSESLAPTQVSMSTALPTHTPFPTYTPVPTHTEIPTDIPTALPEGVELVKLKTEDNIDLVGFLHRAEMPVDDKLAVVLAHGHTMSHEEWAGFEKILVENGITIMTFDFRGHGSSGGASLGTEQFSKLGIDVQTVFNYLEQNGFERIICIGVSMGGTACLAGAIKVDIDGLVMLSSERNLGSELVVTEEEFQALTIPKIIMFTENDALAMPPYGSTVEGYRRTAEVAGEPKEVYAFPGAAHGSVMLQSENGEEVIEILLNFVKHLAK